MSKNWHFIKGVNHGFSHKMTIFPFFFFFIENKGQEDVSYDILEG